MADEMAEKGYKRDYSDIMHLDHPTSKKHPRMALSDRAAQFSPFAALTGYEAAVKETARLTDRRVELDEYEKAELDGRLQMLRENDKKDSGDYAEVIITYFLPDERKDGGSYTTVAGCVKKIDDYEREIVLRDGRKIPLDEIVGVEYNGVEYNQSSL